LKASFVFFLTEASSHLLEIAKQLFKKEAKLVSYEKKDLETHKKPEFCPKPRKKILAMA